MEVQLEKAASGSGGPSLVAGRYEIVDLMKVGATGYLFEAVDHGNGRRASGHQSSDTEEVLGPGPSRTAVVLKVEDRAASKRQMRREVEVYRAWHAQCCNSRLRGLTCSPWCGGIPGGYYYVKLVKVSSTGNTDAHTGSTNQAGLADSRNNDSNDVTHNGVTARTNTPTVPTKTLTQPHHGETGTSIAAAATSGQAFTAAFLPPKVHRQLSQSQSRRGSLRLPRHISVLVMTKLGPTLEELREQKGRMVCSLLGGVSWRVRTL